MTQITLRKELVGKRVFTEGGTELGHLDEIVIDDDTGAIEYLLIRSYGKVSPFQKTDEKGRIICAVENLRIFEGRLIIG